MKYMLLIYGEENTWTEEERAACEVESTQLCHELQAKGQFLDAAPLQSVTTSTCLKVRSGKTMITDGPFVETREQLAGYFLVDVKNLDEALAIANRLPPAKKGTVEIRPVKELSNMPLASARS
jgi:hypothetical protein